MNIFVFTNCFFHFSIVYGVKTLKGKIRQMAKKSTTAPGISTWILPLKF